jgi:extracellular elastinolytic metalloproteinase
LKQTSGAVSDPEARLVYFQKADGSLVLSWRVETDISENWLLTYVDANNGKDIHGVVDYVSEFATMQVFPWNVTDPSQGSRLILEDPWNIDASPYTWFGDGTQNYTTTRGNNGIAHINPDGGSDYETNYRPDSPARQFEYFYSDAVGPKEYVDFSITQLFYTANNYHDVLYRLGFDEPAGNFQTNNNGKGGAGNDFVILNTQDGSGTNNARFGTPPDGSSGRMMMFIWTSAEPDRDSSLDSGVVLHEYTHGCKCSPRRQELFSIP